MTENTLRSKHYSLTHKFKNSNLFNSSTSKKLLTHPEIEIRKLKAPYSIEKWAFFLLLPDTFCEIFVNFLDGYLSGVKINLIKIKRENAYRILSSHENRIWGT